MTHRKRHDDLINAVDINLTMYRFFIEENILELDLFSYKYNSLYDRYDVMRFSRGNVHRFYFYSEEDLLLFTELIHKYAIHMWDFKKSEEREKLFITFDMWISKKGIVIND